MVTPLRLFLSYTVLSLFLSLIYTNLRFQNAGAVTPVGADTASNAASPRLPTVPLTDAGADAVSLVIV